MTPQRELIFRSFFELGNHVSVDELYDRVRKIDRTLGYSTVWRNLKLMCEVGLATEVSVGDGITRYDRLTRTPQGHLYCLSCKQVSNFDLSDILPYLEPKTKNDNFTPDSYKVEVQGYCRSCREKQTKELTVTSQPEKISRRVLHHG